MQLPAIVQKALFEQETRGVKESTAEINKMADAQRNAADAGAVLAKQQDVQVESITRLGSRLDAYGRKHDVIGKTLREVERGEALIAAARNRGLEVSGNVLTGLENARAKYDKLTKGLNDNTKEAAINRAGWINLSRQMQDVGVSLAGGMSPLTVLAQQGSQVFDVFQSSRGGVSAAVKEFGGAVLGFALHPATLLVGTLGAIAFGASKASSALAELGKQTEKIGFSPSATLGANVVGARAGLSNDETAGALGNANKQFEAFQQNSGAVLSAIKLIDAGFLSTLDKARSLPEFVRMIGDEIRKLPPTEGLNLARALLGDDAGKALFGSLDELTAALSTTGAPIDASAKYAADLQKQIDAAAQLAHNDLLAAFEQLTVPLADVKLAFYSIESSIAGAITKAGQLYNTLRSYIPDWTSKSGWLEPLAAGNAPAQLPEISIGASRQRFAGYQAALKNSGHSGKSDAEKEAESFEKIKKELQDQARLAETIGDEHKKIQAEIDKQNWLEKLGTNASEAHRDAVGQLVDKLQAAKTAGEEAQRQQQQFIDSLDIARDSAKDFGSSLVDAFRHGASAAEALRGVLDRLTSKLIDKTLDTGVEALLGKTGTASTGAGVFGSLLSGVGKLFGFAEGGVMTSAGPLPLRTYASGGIADRPQLAMFGEGSRPEAFVPLADGRSIPVKMHGQGGDVTVVNNASGLVAIQAREDALTGKILVAVNTMMDANNKKVPGIIANAQRRSI